MGVPIWVKNGPFSLHKNRVFCTFFILIFEALLINRIGSFFLQTYIFYPRFQIRSDFFSTSLQTGIIQPQSHGNPQKRPWTLVFRTLCPLEASIPPRMYHTTKIQLVCMCWDTLGSIQLIFHGSGQWNMPRSVIQWPPKSLVSPPWAQKTHRIR